MGLPQLSGTPVGAPDSQHLTFALEKLAPFLPEAISLLRLHYDEVAPYKILFVLNLDVEAYAKMEAMGILHILTARIDGKLVGYISLIVKEHIHYRDTLMATDDVHFVHPDYRKGSLGIKLIRVAEQKMKEMGVKVMALRTKVKSNHGLIFERLGFEPMDVVYLKRLDQEP